MKNLLLILSLFCFILACGNSDGPTAENTNVSPTDKQDMTDFYAFYNNFHSDTAYQMAHISFPLEGKPTQGADLVAGEKFYWQREDWAPHRPIDFETSPFERRIIPLGNDLVLEYIAHKKMNAGMMRRFAKLGDEWYLIYYEGMKSN